MSDLLSLDQKVMPLTISWENLFNEKLLISENLLISAV